MNELFFRLNIVGLWFVACCEGGKVHTAQYTLRDIFIVLMIFMITQIFAVYTPSRASRASRSRLIIQYTLVNHSGPNVKIRK